MKLLRSYLFQALLFVAAVVGMQSCSCNKNETIADKLSLVVPDDAEMVFVGDVTRLLTALEVTQKDGGLVLPDYMTELIGTLGSKRDLERAEDKLSEKIGIDYTNMVFVANGDVNRMDAVLCFNVTDVDDLYTYMSDIDDDVVKGDCDSYTTIGDDNATILVEGKTAYFVFKKGRPLADDDAVEALTKWKEKAQEKPLAEWKKQYLTQPCIASMLVGPEMLAQGGRGEFDEIRKNVKLASGIDIRDMTVGMRIDLEGPSLKINATMFDSAGAVMKNPAGGSIDADMLRYTTKSDFAVAAVALSNAGMEGLRAAVLNEINREIESYRQYSYYGNSSDLRECEHQKEAIELFSRLVDGQFMLAAGLNEDVTLTNINRHWDDHFGPLHLVAVAKAKSGQGRELYEQLCVALQQAGTLTAPDPTQCSEDEAMEYLNQAEREYNRAVNEGDSMRAEDLRRSASEFVDNYNYYRTYGDFNGTLHVSSSQSISVPRGDAFKMKFKGTDLYVVLDGDNVVLSNGQIVTNGGSNFDSSLVTGKSFAVQLSIPNTMPVIAGYDLPCGLNVSLSGTEMSFDAEVSLPGTNQNIIPAVCKIVLAVVNR